MPGKTPQQWMQMAVQLAVENVRSGRGGPFAALVIRGDELVAQGANSVLTTNDPTAHAEIVAIRAACQVLQSHQLHGCELYTSCEPCPMCLGAIYWSRPDRFYFCATRKDAARCGFDDDLIYSELPLIPENRSIAGRVIAHELASLPFEAWEQSLQKLLY